MRDLRGSISLRLYPHELAPEALLEELCAQAVLAEGAGFDGVMTSEHHGGFRAYLPNPLQVAGFALAATEGIWAGPCPLLLPLRHWSQTAEDLAWLDARHPDRVVAGFAAGGLARDFEMAELPFDENMQRFKAALPLVVGALRGGGEAPLADDAAIARLAEHAIPCVSAAMSAVAARRAGSLGIGILCDSLQSVERLRVIVDAHRAACAAGEVPAPAAPRVLIRRVWVGQPPGAKVEGQMDFYRGYAAKQAQEHWGGDELVTASEGQGVAEQLAAILRESGCDALNLRVHVHGVGPQETRAQIERVGSEVLPALRRALG